MKGNREQTNLLHGVNWGALNHASHVPQIMSYIYVTMCVYMYVCVHMCTRICKVSFREAVGGGGGGGGGGRRGICPPL